VDGSEEGVGVWPIDDPVEDAQQFVGVGDNLAQLDVER
jgi:hypothetical protein